MVRHTLELTPENFQPVHTAPTRAAFRRDDRQPRYDTGDELLLWEWNEPIALGDDLAGHTRRQVLAVVIHVARGRHIPQGYALLSIKKLGCSCCKNKEASK